MTHHDLAGTSTPVRPATFPDGPDALLLNPAVSRSRWRGERVRAALHPITVLAGLIGVAQVTVAALSESVLTTVFLLSAGIVAVCASVVVGWYDAATMITEHDHARGGHADWIECGASSFSGAAILPTSAQPARRREH